MKRLGIDRPMAKVISELTDILIQQIGYDVDLRLRVR